MLPLDKLAALERRFQELNQLLCDPEVVTDHSRLRTLNQERSDIEPVVMALQRYRTILEAIEDSTAALEDPELRELAEAELPEQRQQLEEIGEELKLLLLPKDPNDARNTLVEIRSGTGGDEAALFAADLFNMLKRYADTKGWKVEILNTSSTSGGGFKEVIALISGKEVYSNLRYEAGVHRVQRVPATETQGRIHTSTATIAVLPEADEVEIDIDDADLEINIAASGGPGGQGVNTTNSAVMIKHVPSGLMVKCQDERSQHKNKARAMKVLRSRLLEIEQRKHNDAITAERRGMVGSGERSEKIRTYNFPQNRVTDHRINLTVHKLEQVLAGDLDSMVGPLRNHRQAELLRAQGDA